MSYHIFVMENQALEIAQEGTDEYIYLAENYKCIFSGTKKQCFDYLDDVTYDPSISIPYTPYGDMEL